MSVMRSVAVPVGAALLLTCAWWLGRVGAGHLPDGTQPPLVTAAATADGGLSAEAPVPQPGRPPEAAPPPPPMPLETTPLHEAWPALLARAEDGDHAAGCRLALSIARCTALPELAQVEVPAPEAIARLPEEFRDGAVDRSAETLEALEQDKALCAGVDDALLERFPAMLLRAARGSDDPHALWAFYDGRGFGRRYLHATEGRRLQREHASWALERLVAQGETIGLVMLPSLDHRFGRPMDPALSAATMTLLRERGRERHGPEAHRGLSDPIANLTPEQRTRAEGLVDDLRRRFGSERRGPERTTSLLDAFDPGGPMGAGIAAYCDAADSASP